MKPLEIRRMTFDYDKWKEEQKEESKEESKLEINMSQSQSRSPFLQTVGSKPKRSWPKAICFCILNIILAQIIFLTFFTIGSHSWDAIYLWKHGDELKAKFNVQPGQEIQDKSAQHAVSLIEIVKDRPHYKESMPKFVNVKDQKSKPLFVLFDYESEPKIDDKIQGVEIVRKETDPSNKEGFNLWIALAYASKAIKSERIFYFDNCNSPSDTFSYDRYLDQKDRNFYFPNNERYFTQNFLLNRTDLVRFVEDLPPHLAIDHRTFFGGGQLMIWYFNSYRGEEMVHISHKAVDDYSKFHSHHIAIWRLFMYMNRYSRPVESTALDSGRCDGDKGLLCNNDFRLTKVLRWPVVWHVIDAMMKLEFVFSMNFAIVNGLNSPVAGCLITLAIFLITVTIFMMILKWSLILCCRCCRKKKELGDEYIQVR